MLATVSTHTTALEAHIVASRLRHEGIPAFLGAEHHIWAKWSLSVALGGVRVQVPGSHIAEARQVVDRINRGEYAQELSAEQLLPLEPQCPACSSTTVVPLRLSEKVALLMVFLYSLVTPYNQHRYKCGACGHKWQAHHERGYPRLVIATYALGT